MKDERLNERRSGEEKRTCGVAFFGTALILGCLVMLGEGCGRAGATGGDKLSIGYLDWDENVANSALIEVLAEDELGYEVDLLRADDVAPAFEGVASGETDVFMDAWMPAHQKFIGELDGKVRLSDEPWYVGKTEFGIAVPDYMEDVESIEDLNDSGSDMITGIEPGALIMDRIQGTTIPEYGLDLALVESSTPAMLTELDRAYEQREPFVFIGWSPHWMNARYEFHYLADPKGTLDGITTPSTLHSVYRKGFEEENPVAYALIDSMRLTKEQVDDIGLEINRSGSPEEGARKWVEEHPDVVDPWLDSATAAGGLG